MRAAWRIAKKDLLLRLRDKSAILLGIVVPLALGFIFNLIFGGAFSGGTLITLGMVQEDSGEVAVAFEDMMSGIAASGVIDVVEAPDAASLREMVDGGEVGAGLVFPAGTSSAVGAGEQAELVVVADVDASTSASVASAVAAAFGSAIGDVQLALAAAGAVLGDGFDPQAAGELAGRAATMPPVMTVAPIQAENRILDPQTFFAASMAVFFVFFLVQFGVTGLLDEQREGTLTRLQAAPIPRWAVVAGKALTSFLLSVVALVVLAAATTALMGANWGHPLGVLALIIAVSLAATAIMGVVAGLARTPEGAGNVGAVIAVALGMLGGTFFPVAGANPVIEVLALATPHTWFLRGLGALSAGAGLAEIVVPLLALLGFAVGVGAVAAVLLKRRYT